MFRNREEVNRFYVGSPLDRGARNNSLFFHLQHSFCFLSDSLILHITEILRRNRRRNALMGWGGGEPFLYNF